MITHPIGGLLVIFLNLTGLLLNILLWVIIISVVLSWLVAFNVINTRNPYVSQITYFLHRFTEKLYAPVRKVIPTFSGLDISPMIILIGITFIQGSILPYLYGLIAYYFAN